MSRISIYTGMLRAALKNEFYSLKLNHAFTNSTAIIDIQRRGSSFIHINKNGGSTIEQVLGIKDQLHIPYCVLEDYLGVEKAASLQLSTIVRNPFDRVVSQYHYRFLGNQMGYASKNLTFKDFVMKAYKERSSEVINYPWMFARQTEWLYDYRLRLGHIGCLVYFEEFNHSVKKIADFHKVELNTSKLPQKRKSKRSLDWREYYDDQTRSVILKYFETDFDEFNYHDSF